MNQHISPGNNYDVSDSSFYQSFQNATGLTTNNIAYEVVGSIAYSSMRARFASEAQLRICDVGCYLGSSSERWHRHGNRAGEGMVHVLGVDIHESNVRQAVVTYPHISFQHIERGSEIPLIGGHRYHGMFATFVLDTIHRFEDVEQLCRNMVRALLPGGEIYLLRLHPNSLQYEIGIPFQEYRLPSKSSWSHGDPLQIHLINEAGEAIAIDDRYWEPAAIAQVFEAAGCAVNCYDVSMDSTPLVAQELERQIEMSRLSRNMPEWSVPLYQIMRVQKHGDFESSKV